MLQSHSTSRLRGKMFAKSPVVLLAFWQLRQTWRLLLVVGVGMTTAVMLVSSAPLYAKIVATAGLHETLNADPANTYLTIHSTSSLISPNVIADTTQHLNEKVHSAIGSYLADSQFSLELTNLPFPAAGRIDNTMQILAFSMEQAAHHAKIVQGRLPRTNSNVLELAITPSEAKTLHAHIGSVFNVLITYLNPARSTRKIYKLPFHIVGIFTVATVNDSFWHENDFQPVTEPSDAPDPPIDFYGLASNDTLISVLVQASNDPKLADTNFDASDNPDLFWYYHLDVSRIDTNNMDNLVNGYNIPQKLDRPIR